jgi:hypothetical protein
MNRVSWFRRRTATFLRSLCVAEATWGMGMTDAEYARKLDELDRLLNDPDVPMEPPQEYGLSWPKSLNATWLRRSGPTPS